VANPERLSAGLILPFTQKWTNPKYELSGLIVNPEILNPEFKVGLLEYENF